MLKISWPLFLVLSLSGVAYAAESLVFLPKVHLAGVKEVTLADLVDRQHLSSGELQNLQNVRISSLPAKNAETKISAQLISSAIRKNLKKTYSEIKIPNEVIVVNQKAALSKELVYEQLLWHFEQKCDGCRVEIKNIQLPKIPAELLKTPWRLEPQQRLPKGSFSEKIIVHDQTGREITYWVSGEVKIYHRVPVALRTIMPQQKLSADDYKWEWRDTTYAIDGVASEQAIEDMQARQGIAANQVIWANSLVKEKAVKRGELVQVHSGGQDWKVTLQAVTEQDGYLGDVINVRNVQTKKVISGEVIAPGEIVAR